MPALSITGVRNWPYLGENVKTWGQKDGIGAFMTDNGKPISRRTVLRNATFGATTVGVVALSGCTGDSGDGGGDGGDSGDGGGDGGDSGDGDGDGGDSGDGDGDGGGSATTSLKVGVLLPLSGAYAPLGEDARAGIRVAEQHASEDYDDLSADLLYRDSQLQADTGLRKAKELVEQENVDALVVGDGTPVVNSVAQYCVQQEVPNIATISALEATTMSDCYPYTFRTSTHSFQNMKPTAEWTTENLGTKVATWGADYSWGRESVGNFVEVAEANGAEIVEQVWPDFGATDYSSQIQKVSASGADFVMIRAGGSDMINAYKQIDSFGLGDEMDIVGIASEAEARGAGEAALGYYGNTPYYFGIDTEANNRFVADYRSQTDGGIPSTYSNSSYTGAKVLFEAAVNGSTDGPSLQDTMEGLTISTPLGEQELRACDHQIEGPQWMSRFVEESEGDLPVGLEFISKSEAENNSRPCSAIECDY
jgi:ABC-type branched-subunit amino acid transport system substrate-binding protein